MERKISALLFLFFILFTSQTTFQGAEGRVCISQSHGFKGPCGHDHNCALVCRNEGFSGGDCIGVFIRKCYCTKNC
ncbi:Defensin-like protein 6 [Capsicum chinense]|nr:Defensin-like protein 6 [Capsicum chinense]